MKRLLLTLCLCMPMAVSVHADSSYDLSAELKSAERLIYKEKYKKAIRKLKKAVSEEPRDANAWNLLGYASRKKGDLEQSSKAYQKALKIDPEHKDALEYQGELYLMQGDSEAAQGNLAKLKQLCPDGCEQLDELTQAIANKQ